MADNHSFDIVSQVDYQEVSNAVNQAIKEVQQRFDLKDSGTKIDLNQSDAKISLASEDEYKVKSVYEILQAKLAKRNLPLKAFKAGKIEKALGGMAKQEILIQQGINKDAAKEITRIIKDTKLKVQTQIQDDQLRVTGKKIDELQSVIKILQDKNLDIPTQYINFR